ncbi:galactose mutarotase [Croceibacterium sp. LX-88]|uniref:Aldose 1-epimerase n=1 Tax=Croceibacterium selenioxidans TaxID=2838833 RepID=A0ABS5W4K4_9SPHN|nr:aldose epimerase family protein [Croceibacterium selenioxidans]MBT2134693.1 galactose mutarotase [Croceibacterium selenioxidans]
MKRASLLALVLAAWAVPADAATASRETFGSLPDGREVAAIVLTNQAGMKVRILAYGALVQELTVPGRSGPADVVLGYDGIEGYLAAPNYFGASVGRYANRIAGGRFELDGKAYQLARNDGPNALHGGVKGFDKRLWTVGDVSANAQQASVTLTYLSPDGEEGYPGTLQVSATYTLTESNDLKIDYRATTDKATIVNLTNHSYFNLAGANSGVSILESLLKIPAETFTPVDETLIPTGEFRSVSGTPFDFLTLRRIGDRIRDGRDAQLRFGRGYDHNWVVSRTVVAEPQVLAYLEDPASGRVMEVLSNQPGIQFYTGNFLDGTVTGKAGTIYRMGDALCLEPQIFPDTPNQPEFGSARLDPGKVYQNSIVYRFSVKPPSSGS